LSGDVAQLGERRLCTAEAIGSIPFISTIVLYRHQTVEFYFMLLDARVSNANQFLSRSKTGHSVSIVGKDNPGSGEEVNDQSHIDHIFGRRF
jgi:hypothetical protein